MAYGLRYYREFKNNIQDVYRIEIYQKDYTGEAVEISTTGNPFKLKYQSGNDKPINPIRESECDISMWSEDWISLLDFYSEDDEQYRVDFILLSVHDNDGLYTFYSGNADVNISGNSITINNQTSRHGIQDGMIIDILGVQYNIIGAFYSAGFQTIRLDVDATPPAGSYTGEDFTILDFVNTDVNLLKWRGFIVQDNCQEEFQDPPYEIKLNATDNIALLKDITLDVAAQGKYITQKSATIIVVGNNAVINDIPVNPFSSGDFITIDGNQYEITGLIYNPETNVLNMTLLTTPGSGTYTTIYKTYGLADKIRIIDYLRIAITATGVVLPVRIFANFLEENQNDADADEPYSQTRFFSGKYLNEDGTWQNTYSVIEDILFRLNATLIQADGYWNVIRQQELRQYNNALPGVQFDENFENPVAIILNNTFTIKSKTDVEFINADATKRIQRPEKFDLETFNYVQPKSLILGADLQTLGAFIGSSTAVVDGINYRYDKYQIPAFWSHENSAPNSSILDASYIVVVTNMDENVETERYIYQPFIAYGWKSMEFNPIEVTKGDIFNLSFQAKNVTTDGSDWTRLTVRFYIITAAGVEYSLVNYDPGGGNPNYLMWNLITTDPVVTDGFWKTGIGVNVRFNQDTNNYQFYDLSQIGQEPLRPKIPPIPADGMLRIGLQSVYESNLSAPAIDIIVKDIRIEFTFYINDNLKVIGQTHKSEQPENIKNNFDEQIQIDDSPRNTIAGTLFLNELVGFLTDIGYLYFNKTSLWHRRGITESRRLGDIMTAERKQISCVPRTVMDGTVFGLRTGNQLITPLSVALIYTLPNLNFIFGVCEFDFYRNTFNSTLWELYKTGEVDADADYEFKYLYETT